ncbi:hypothetical protein [Bradyrhizobium guangxiense]|uniref:hypothetical protein n=1 Tax=Bradyrhizobium guangxiense TaxID=1325115 RepID=UPI001008E427|nr:hypothetical protein [Bradyrhizobium guangxiense]
MNLKIQHANDAVLQHSDELLRAHQLIIDSWYASWSNEQRERAAALYRRKEISSAVDETKAG